jgi:hypothetical protein
MRNQRASFAHAKNQKGGPVPTFLRLLEHPNASLDFSIK